SKNQHAEATGNRFRPLIADWRREPCRRQIGAARQVIDRDCARAYRCRHKSDDCGFGPETDDRDVTVAPRWDQRQMAPGVDGGAVRAFADWKSRDLPPIRCRHDRNRILSTRRDDLPPLRVIGNSGWSFAAL